jgi:RNA polymerase sigma-70 factor (ECF subfamily)
MSEADRDAELLDRVLGGDETAFRALYRAHSGAAYAMALRLLAGNHADAEDALQEAWLRATRGLRGFRRSSAFRTWLVGITIRVALEVGRGRRPAPADITAPTVASAPSFDVAMDLERLIAQLPFGYRTVLLLHDLHGHTHDEIAVLLEIETGTSKSQLSRGRRLLRQWLSKTAQGVVP